MIQGVIFDLDGVLLMTDEFHYLSWKKLADRLGIPFDREINRGLRGISRRDSLDIILGDRPYTEEERISLAEEKNRTYRAYLSKLTEDDVSPEVGETIRSLKTRGIRIAVGSSSRNARFILERVGLISCFDAIVDGNEVTVAKPDPEVFLLAAKRLSLAPASCVVVEDADSGIEAAVRGGFVPVGISAAAGNPSCEGKLSKLTDLLPFLDKRESSSV